MKTIVRFIAPVVVLIPSACSLIADVDRSKIPTGDTGATGGGGGSAATGEGGSGDTPSTGGSSGKGGSAGTSTGGTGGKGGGAGASGSGGTTDGGMGGEPDAGGTGGEPVGGTGGEPVVGGAGGETAAGGSGGSGGDPGSGGAPDTAGVGGESGAGGCELETCGTECVDTSTDAANCGACDRACSDQNTSALACAGGQCAPTCASGFADCTTDDGERANDDGCETNLNDNATCGTSCGNLVECEPGDFCIEGVCQDECQAPNTECGSACVNLDDQVAHCGACDRACSDANTSATECSGGLCEPTCETGFDDCIADSGSGADDGCETELASSTTSCNACGRACSLDNASATACESGACSPTCDADHADCRVDTGSGLDDGCETDVKGDPTNCGGCGRECSDENASDTACFAGRCDPACLAGFDDCVPDNDGTGADDGCETNVDTSTSHCNACGRACGTAGASSTSCSSGLCNPVCLPTFGNCVADDGVANDDGCETDFDSPATCGTVCGGTVACASGETCISGVCSTAATGVVKVLVPLSAGGQGQRFNILHQDENVDLDGANVTFRVYAPNAINGNLSIFFLGGAESEKTLVPFDTIDAGFTDVVVPVPAAGGGFDPTAVSVIRIEVETPPESTGPWEQPATVVYIDSVTSDDLALNDTFDTNPISGLFSNSGARPLAGSQEKYLRAAP